MSDDALDYVVRRPPRTERGALQTATEQHGYVESDLRGTVAEHQAALVNQTQWFFWWD